MHKLCRVVRFSVNPFLPQTPTGYNSYCSKPGGEGLAVFFALWVELEGAINSDTGFVVNLVDIDRTVRLKAVPIFDKQIRESFSKAEHIDLERLCECLAQSGQELRSSFKTRLSRLSLELNPLRKVTMDMEDSDLIYYSEKFEFAAMHKLWNDKFSDEKNFEVFGKCANPTGHGHNYVVEVTVKVPRGSGFSFGSYSKVVDENFIELVDHKNLNADVEFFADKNPTVENITAFGWGQLSGKFGSAVLDEVRVWENDRAFCSYRGQQAD